jgi:phage shock protein E
MKRAKFMLCCILCPVILFSACSKASDTNSSYHKITAQEAKRMLDSREGILIDVRTPEEYALSHIPGAILIPNESIGEKKPEELSSLSEPLLIYCRSGRRSKEAAEKLTRLGYTAVYDFGGIVDWPYEVTSGGVQK